MGKADDVGDKSEAWGQTDMSLNPKLAITSYCGDIISSCAFVSISKRWRLPGGCCEVSERHV